MIIQNLKLKNYRNYEQLDIKLDRKLNIFIGNNAQGKTNILESIYVLAVTKSYLGINDKGLIKFGNECAKILAIVVVMGVKKKLEVVINLKEKKVKINDKEIKKFKDYISTFNVIVFSPENIRMIKDGPGIRRRFLNVEISQISNKYLSLMNDFNVVLKQRNEFIRNSNYVVNRIYWEILNDKFSDLAVEIYLERKKFIDNLNSLIGRIYKEITGSVEILISYVSNIDFDSDKEKMKKKLFEKLNDSFEKEKKYGLSLYGPHRDDFHFYLGEKNISLYGSQGQLRMAVLALKLAEVEIFKSYTSEYPVLLLDDIFSELDISKRNNLIKYISSDVQTIITTTDLEMIDKRLVEGANVYVIDDGKVIDFKEGKC